MNIQQSELGEKIKEEELERISFAVRDILDEDLIRQDLAGVNVDELVYEFPLGGKMIQGLTVFGAIQMARLACDVTRNIRIESDKAITEERADSWKASVKVTYTNFSMSSSLSVWGSKVQSKTIKNSKGELIREDPNSEQISEVKALRNALTKIFPPKTATEFINRWRKEGKIRAPIGEEINDAIKRAQDAKSVNPQDQAKL